MRLPPDFIAAGADLAHRTMVSGGTVDTLSRDELIAVAATAMVELAQMRAHLATIEESRPFTTRVAVAANEDRA